MSDVLNNATLLCITLSFHRALNAPVCAIQYTIRNFLTRTWVVSLSFDLTIPDKL